MLLDTMDFDGKDDIISKVSANGTMYDMMLQYQQLALALAQKYEPQTAAMIAGGVGMTSQGARPMQSAVPLSSLKKGSTGVEKARDEAQERTQPR